MIESGVFIADAHLTVPEKENYRTLLSFLDCYKGKVDALFIVGDLFDFWVGLPTVVFSNYVPLLSKLLEWKECGSKIFYTEGNHDFNLGEYFTHELATIVNPHELTLQINGKHYYITHGDLVHKGNYQYRALRFILRSRVLRVLFHITPPFFIWKLSQAASRKSRNNRDKLYLFNREMIKNYALTQWKSGIDIVVLAHFHKEFIEEVVINGRTHIVTCLGDWEYERSYLTVNKDELILGKWQYEL